MIWSTEIIELQSYNMKIGRFGAIKLCNCFKSERVGQSFKLFQQMQFLFGTIKNNSVGFLHLLERVVQMGILLAVVKSSNFCRVWMLKSVHFG